MLPYGPRGHAQIALDGAAAAPDLRGDGGGRPALAVQGPHLVIERVPPGRTLGRLLLDKRGRGWGWYRHGDCPIGERDRLLAHRRIDRIEGVVVLYAIIRSDGRVDSVRVLEGFDERLNENARKALEQWRFRPGTKDGQPIDIEAVVRVPFKVPRSSF